MERQQQLRRLVELESVVCRWSTQLARNDRERMIVREYLRTLAELEVGLVREVRQSGVRDPDVMLIVDEFAESVRMVSRPRLPAVIERAVVGALAASSRH